MLLADAFSSAAIPERYAELLSVFSERFSLLYNGNSRGTAVAQE
jgi:hypothetical protein